MVGLNRPNSQLMAIITVTVVVLTLEPTEISVTVTVTVGCYGCHEYSLQIGQTFIHCTLTFQLAVQLIIQKIIIIEHIFTTLLLTEHWAIDKLTIVFGCQPYSCRTNTHSGLIT